MPQFVFFRRAEELMTVRVRNGLVVGRDASCDAHVPDPAVSRKQFAIEAQGDDWFLVDLSGRGTDVGGKLETRARLQDGMDIGLGRFRAVFLEYGEHDGSDVDTQAGKEGVTETLRLPSGREGHRRSAPTFLVHLDGWAASPLRLEERISVGTAPDAHLRLTDPHVSALHCYLEPVRGGVRVVDRDSKNGTFAGELRLRDADVPVGTTLRLGETELRIAAADAPEPEAFQGLLGQDDAMQRVFRMIERVARSRAPVLITGESGTGKELVAQAIHQRSERAKGPFEAVNCGALTPNLVESELFGHVKGAFTGAERDTAGAFERADGGTIFLDELGEMAETNQAKLLRVLETNRVQRVGGATAKPVDFRVVAATNVNLQSAMRSGGFREDLYYRLAVIHIALPPLRARRGDLRALIEHFVRMFEPRGSGVGIAGPAMQKLMTHEWPGNIRELRNVIHRALLLREGMRIGPDDIVFDEADAFVATKKGKVDTGPLDCRGKTLRELEDEIIRKSVAFHDGNIHAVARELDVSRTFIYSRLGGRGGKGDA